MRKIQPSEFSVKLLCAFVSSLGRIFRSCKKASIVGLSAKVDERLPLPKLFIEEYAFVPRCVVRWLSHVTGILRLAAFSKIVLTIVETVPIDMIHILRRTSINDEAMHQYDLLFDLSKGIGRIAMLCVQSRPIPSIHALIIFDIDDSGVTPSQRYQSVRLVARLNDRMSWRSRFTQWHGLNFNMGVA